MGVVAVVGQLAPLALICVLLALQCPWLVDGIRAKSDSKFKPPQDAEWEGMSPQQRADWCDTLSPLYQNIKDDLAPWAETGISRELQHMAFKHHTARVMGQKGVALGFKGGKAYAVDEPAFTLALGHHVGLFVVYMKAMAHVQRLFGELIPDVEFVISTVDRPLGLARDPSEAFTAEPVMRFCKTAAHTDILIPNFHSHIHQYTGGLAPQLDAINREYPWAEKEEVLFGRFTPYFRHMHTGDPNTRRRGFNGVQICKNESRNVASCTVRHHFCDWATNASRADVDVSCKKRAPMMRHAKYKWLLHLDGQGLSSRFEQLLHLKSLIFKEESGYRAYFYRMLEPHVHYIPFWKDTPNEILDLMQWAREHDAEAAQIAENAQAFVRKYLSARARACYWFKLISEYAKLLKYTPGKTPGSKVSEYWVPLDDFLENVAKPFGDGHWYSVFKFMP